MTLLNSSFGEMATASYANIADSIYESNWQDLNVGLQKYYILMIGNAQRPVYYHGLGIVILSLETFGNVIKTVISYYMAIKALTSE